MLMRSFAYHDPETLPEALEILSRCGPEAKPLAGGTDLLLAMKHGLRPEQLVSLARLTELNRVVWEDDRVRIGAMTNHHRLATDPELAARAPVLTKAVGLIGSWQIRNAATIGGNLCNASPAADSTAPLLALDASVAAVGPTGARIIPLGDFFTGPGETVLRTGELVREIIVPLPPARSSGRYLKLMRKHAVDLALLGAAVQISLDSESRTVSRAAIGLGGLAPTPIRAPEAEAILTGLSLAEAEAAAEEAAESAAAATSPISDVRAGAEYRKTVARAYVLRGVLETLGQLRGEEAAR